MPVLNVKFGPTFAMSAFNTDLPFLNSFIHKEAATAVAIYRVWLIRFAFLGYFTSRHFSFV